MVLGGVDRASFVAALGTGLRSAGVPVTFTSLAAFTRALALSQPSDLRSLYWVARLTLVNQPHDLATFDAVFRAVFNDAVLPVDPHARRKQQGQGADEDDALVPVSANPSAEQSGEGLPWHTLPRVAESVDEGRDGQFLPELLPSAVEALVDTPFEDLDEHQLALLGAWFERSL